MKTTMKTVLKVFLFALAGLLALLLLYLGVQSIRLKWWVKPERVPLAELTPEQKAADMRYLLDLTRRVSQANAVWEAAGLDNPLEQPEVWIERARQTQSNAEFADLVLQILVHAGQGGHAFLAYDIQFNPTTSLVGDIRRDAFYKMPAWGEVVSGLAWNAHADLNLTYHKGRYTLLQKARLGSEILPAGSVVEAVDGLPADEYVLRQQYRAHLRYDPLLKKFYLHPLLIVDPGPERTGWDVDFRMPGGELISARVPKISGYPPHRPDEDQSENTRCMALEPDVLYIRMLSFSGAAAAQDAATLRGCFASGSYQKAIFDVRGNSGGEVWSYMDNIIAPLIRQPLTLKATAAVKDSFYRWYGPRLWLYHAATSNELTDPNAHVERVEKIAHAPYSNEGWRFVRITRRIQPAAEPYPFDGQVYVLADNNTLSAGDSFAAVMQRSGLATVAGVNTTGWGQGYLTKMPYALPHSGLVFYLDSELTLNPDGSLNNYTGVLPDVILSPSTYPTPYPQTFTRSVIMADEWVRWVMADKP